jgi:hypothetical protein
VEFTGVHINVRELPASGVPNPAASGKSTHELMVSILGNSITVDALHENAVDATIVTVVFGADGKNSGQTERHLATKLQPEMLQKIRKSALGVKQSLELAPGRYDIRIAVRDNLNGEIGSVEYPLAVK